MLLRRSWTASLVITVAGAAVVMAAGCRKIQSADSRSASTTAHASSSGPSVTAGSGSARVTYQPNVKVLAQDEGVNAIEGVSTNGAGFLLNASNPNLRSLAAGDVLVIKGLLAKKIIASEMEDDNTILVLTQPASLTDAIQDGHIAVSAPVRFGSLSAESAPPGSTGGPLDRFIPPVYAQSPDNEAFNKAVSQGNKDAYGNMARSVVGAIAGDWKTDFSAVPGDGQVNLKLNSKKAVGGFLATITGDGYVSNFDFDSDISVEHSTYDKVSTGIKNLNGAMNFGWEVATDTPGAHTGDDRIKLPAAIEIPLYRYLDGLPLFLEISSALIIQPALSGGKEYSRGKFRITYDGYQHFSRQKEGNMDSEGNVKGDIQFLEGQNISALAPMGMVVAFAAPRIELTFGISKVLPFSDMKSAASKVDFLLDKLAKYKLSPDQYQALKNSPLGEFPISKALENATKSDAAAYFEMVSSAGMSFTGISAITPCTRHDIHLWGKVGATTEVFGIQMGKTEKEIYRKDFIRIDPPGTHLCEAVGAPG